MSEARRQAYIDAPVDVVWELLEDVDRHPEWWPRVLEVECDEDFEPGCTYREVIQGPVGKDDMRLHVERMEDCKELLVRCLNTGTFVHMLLTEAQALGGFRTVWVQKPPRPRQQIRDQRAPSSASSSHRTAQVCIWSSR